MPNIGTAGFETPYIIATQDEIEAAARCRRRVLSYLGTQPVAGPVDITFTAHGQLHGVEIVVLGAGTRIAIHPESVARKRSWAERSGAFLHMVVVTPTGLHYRAGIVSCRVPALTRVRDAAHLRALMGLRQTLDVVLDASGRTLWLGD